MPRETPGPNPENNEHHSTMNTETGKGDITNSLLPKELADELRGLRIKALNDELELNEELGLNEPERLRELKEMAEKAQADRDEKIGRIAA